MATDTSTLARPYAKAAFEFAVGKNKLAKWSEFLTVAATFVENSDVQRLLQDPRVENEKIVALLKEIAPETAENENNFLLILAEKDRLKVLPDIAALYETYRNEHEKAVNVQVKTFMPLNDEQTNKLTAALKKRLEKEVSLVFEVDETLLGGAIIRAGDRVIDGSVRGKLERMRTELAG